MQTRSQTRAKAFKWGSLPAEIRLMILEAVAHQKSPGWGSLASVCREWRAFLNEGIWRLCSILSTWEPAYDLALEINVYSPSDCDHWFKNIYLSSDDTEHDNEETMLEALRTDPVFHDPKHGWEHGRQVKAPPSSALSHLFKRTWLTCTEAMPRIKAVTSFIIRRQLRRCIGPMGLGLFLSKFDRLERISYEPWAPYDEEAGQFLDRGTHPLL
ncbi:hypothetical protein Daesc_009137 [Daldinia eschscholtzii]|uniref:F-box domain-containing protein n=1 Tax=Daldinia eschscholtzii TaxID=292717 RepID=A0AAX6M9D1_9PEZI